MFGIQGTKRKSQKSCLMCLAFKEEESKSSGWIFLICLASKEENVYIIKLGICILHSHTLQKKGNGFKDTSS